MPIAFLARSLVALAFALLLGAGLTPARAQPPFKHCTTCPLMVTLPAATVTFAPGGQTGQLPQTQGLAPFAISRTEVTRAQWRAAMGHYPKSRPLCVQPTCPAETLSWLDAQAYTDRLSQRTGHTCRLPTEAEWVYAARGQAGYSMAAKATADNTPRQAAAQLGRQAWFAGNSDEVVHPVAGKQPNGFGLHDMLGNVWEWAQGCYLAEGGSNSTQDCSLRMVRGGAFDSRGPAEANTEFALALPIATRNQLFTGLRVVLELPLANHK